MGWRSNISRWLQSREVRLLFIGILLVASTYWFFERMNSRGAVMLEFVGYERRGTNSVDGTIMAFRLINESGGPITYSGFSEVAPFCDVKPMVADEFNVLGGALTPSHMINVTYFMPPQYFVLCNGEERIVYAKILYTEQSWMMKMHYWEGSPSGDWVKKLPTFAQGIFTRDVPSLPNSSVLSEPVHCVVPWVRSSYFDFSNMHYFMTENRTNRNGRVTAKMKCKWLKEPFTVITVETE